MIRKLGALLTLALVLMLTSAAAAPGATSMRFSISRDPVRGLPVHFMVSGTTPANPGAAVTGNRFMFVALARPARWGPCAADQLDDPSSRGGSGPASSTIEGPAPLLPQRRPFTVTWSGHLNYQSLAGGYLLCVWLEAQPAYQTAATAHAPFTIHKPQYRLRISVPAHSTVGGRGAFTVRGRAQAPGWVDEELLPPYAWSCNNSGTRCHKQAIHKCTARPFMDTVPNPNSADYYRVLSKAVRGGGAFKLTRKLLARQPGRWTFCAYMHESSDGSRGDGGYGPIALLRSARFTVGPHR